MDSVGLRTSDRMNAPSRGMGHVLSNSGFFDFSHCRLFPLEYRSLIARGRARPISTIGAGRYSKGWPYSPVGRRAPRPSPHFTTVDRRLGRTGPRAMKNEATNAPDTEREERQWRT